MSKPAMKWRGSVEAPAGIASFVVGPYHSDIDFKQFSEAHEVFTLIQEAFEQGRQSGQDDMIFAMTNCRGGR